jgi:hypothetical protein
MGPNPRLIDLFIVLQQQGLIARIFHVHMKLFEILFVMQRL